MLSGPNEGQNLGLIVNSSGTIGIAQLAAGCGLSAIALSAGSNTVDNAGLAHPNSAIVAQLSIKLLQSLQAKAGNGALLAPGVALNVNFPDAPTANSKFAFSRIGSFEIYNLKFRNAVPNGLGASINDASTATPEQAEDEAVV